MSEPTRRVFLSSLLAAEAPIRPNVLFILADSWRGQALPMEGDPNLIAPNLSRLAREGVHCSRAYTSYAVCCPSRAAILTGKFPHAAGIRRNHSLLPLDQPTMSAALKDAGYRTGFIGKWHLDGGESPGFVPPQRRRGFDFWAAYNIVHRHYDGVYFRDTPTPLPAPGFEADFQTGIAIDFIRQPSRQPFFLYLALVPPHSPFTPPEQYATYNPAQLALRPNVPERNQAEARKDLAGYYGLCTAVDANLGRLLKELDDRNLARDTIVVFTSDHGHMLRSQGIDGFDVPFEESTRVPLLIRYPRRIKPGSEEKMLVSNVDYAPTLLSLCGVRPLPSMQGIDHRAAWTRNRRRPYGSIYAEGALGEKEEWRMVVSGRHKLVAGSDMRPTHCYDLSQDPYELNNLVAQPRERATGEALLTLLRRWMIRTP